MIVDFSGDYLSGKNVTPGEIVEILNEGEYEMRDDQQHPGQQKQVLNLKVKYKGKDKIYTPNQTSGQSFEKAWGVESKNWIGKKFTITLKNTNFGLSIIAVPAVDGVIPVQQVVQG